MMRELRSLRKIAVELGLPHARAFKGATSRFPKWVHRSDDYTKSFAQTEKLSSNSHMTIVFTPM